MPTRALVLIFALSLSGCVDFPELGDAITPAGRAAPYPTLAPLDALLSEEDSADDTRAIDTLAARAADLRRRAEALRQTTID